MEEREVSAEQYSLSVSWPLKHCVVETQKSTRAALGIVAHASAMSCVSTCGFASSRYIGLHFPGTLP